MATAVAHRLGDGLSQRSLGRCGDSDDIHCRFTGTGVGAAAILAWSEPDRTQRARLGLMRSLARPLLWLRCQLNAAHALNTMVPETDLSAPTRAEFAEAVEQERPAVGSPEPAPRGKMALASFLTGVTTPEFEEALAIVRQG